MNIKRIFPILFVALSITGITALTSSAALFPPMSIEPELLVPEASKPQAPERPGAVRPERVPVQGGVEVFFNPSRYKRFQSSDVVIEVLFTRDSGGVIVRGPKSVEHYLIAGGGEGAGKNQGQTARRDFPSSVTSIALSPNGEFLSVGTKKGYIYVLDAESLKQATFLKSRKSRATAMGFNLNGNMLAAGFADGHVELWDVDFQELDGVMKGHSKRVHTLSFLPDGIRLVTVGDDLLTKFWDTSRKKELRSFRESKHRLTLASLSVDSGLIALYAKTVKVDLRRNRRIDSRFLIVRDTSSGEEVRKFELSSDSSAIAFYPNQRYVASASVDGVIIIWDIMRGDEAASIDLTKVPVSIDFSPDGKLVAFSEESRVTVMKLGGM